MKHVVFVLSSGLVNAGVPKVCIDIFNQLNDKYNFSFIVSADNKEYFDDYIIDNGGKIYYIGERKRGLKKYFNRVFTQNIQLYKIFKSNNFDILHTCNGLDAGFDCFVACLAGINNRIIHSHGNFSLERVNNKNILKLCYRELCDFLIKKFSTKRLAVSQIAGNSLFCEQTYKVILNPVDLDFYSEVKHEKHDIYNLLQIGYYHKNKNQLFSIYVLDDLHKRGLDVKLYFIGYPSQVEYFDSLKEAVKKLNLSDDVVFLPCDYDKKRAFSMTDYVLIPSLSEGLSLVALEAQAAGVKCIASTAVPRDVNIGMLARIELDPHIWADMIESRDLPTDNVLYDKSEFSISRFAANISRIYSE